MTSFQGGGATSLSGGVKSGELRHVVNIQQQARTPNASGGYTETWNDFAVNLYCKIEPLAGEERYLREQINDELTHRITMRYYPGVSSKMRVLYGTRVFQIEQVLNTEERNRVLTLYTRELVAP